MMQLSAMRFSKLFRVASLVSTAALVISAATATAKPAKGWYHFRGPQQDGTSLETGLPDTLDLGKTLLWTAELSGQSSPTIFDGKLYVMGYTGDGPDLQEMVACFDAESGKKLWDHRWNDFLSDIIYTRYSTSNPTVDPATGNVYVQGTQGIIAGFTGNGKKLWEYSMMDRFGRMTFPNGRTAAPVIDDNLVVTHHITAYWGAMGPARDRFLAFDKITGELVYLTTPGGQPKDSSYSPPVASWWNGQRVFYCGTGDGAVVCFNARTGKPLWYTKISQGGVNAGVLIYKDTIIAIHGRENLDNSEIGRMVALRIPKSIPEGASPHQFPVTELEIWRNGLSSFASSPVLVDDIAYIVNMTGDLNAVEAASGKILWSTKLGIEQRNATMVHAEGKLYVPMLEDPHSKESGADAGTKGAFYIVKSGRSGGEIQSKVQLDGRCFGSPCVYNGKVYLQTTKNLYCWGTEGDNKGRAEELAKVKWPKAGKPAALHMIPNEVLLRPGQKQEFRILVVDEKGFTVEELRSNRRVAFESFIPPTAKVKVRMNAKFDSRGRLVAADSSTPSAGMFKATYKGLTGFVRGRILPDLPIKEDFESFKITNTHPENHPEAGEEFTYPPLPWIGARFKFEIRENDGDQDFIKTIDNKLFQRGIVFLGHPDMSDYTMEADVMTEGNRRKMSEVGFICQRYYVILKGNSGKLQINSNLERIKEETSFRMKPNTWYRLKARVDRNKDGSGVVRAKAWPKDQPEPDAWTLELNHKIAHDQGSPGLFGFAPQEIQVHIDNLAVTSNK